MKVTFETELNLGVYVEAEYKPGTPAQVTRLHPNGLPGDPEDIKLLKVEVFTWKKEGSAGVPVCRTVNILEALTPFETETLLDLAADLGRDTAG